MKKAKKRGSDTEDLDYRLSEQEHTVLSKQFARLKSQTGPRAKLIGGDKVSRISVDHPNEMVGLALLREAIGTGDVDFFNGLLGQLVGASSPGREIDEKGLNFMLSIIKGVEPKDQIESMLAAQMAAVHMATMTFARRLQRVETLPQQDSAERAFNKLARTFATQMEALKRYRTGGEQKIMVQHVSVQEGGQAIVGNVTQSPRETPPEKIVASPPALTDARTAPMPIIADSKECVRIPTQRRSRK